MIASITKSVLVTYTVTLLQVRNNLFKYVPLHIVFSVFLYINRHREDGLVDIGNDKVAMAATTVLGYQVSSQLVDCQQ